MTVNGPFKEKLRQARVPSSHYERAFSNFRFTPQNTAAATACRLFAFNIAAQPGQSLYISGPPQSGKTHLAIAVIRQILQSTPNQIPLQVLHLTCRHYLKLRLIESKSPNRDPLLTAALDSSLLLLDNLGTEIPTPWSLAQLFRLIHHRYNRLQPTIITSPFNLQSLIDLYRPMDSQAAQKLHTRLDSAYTQAVIH